MIGKSVKTTLGRTGVIRATRKVDGQIVEALIAWFNGEWKWVDPGTVTILAIQPDK